jgi:hypothetical protein
MWSKKGQALQPVRSKVPTMKCYHRNCPEGLGNPVRNPSSFIVIQTGYLTNTDLENYF